jgi:CubicO group peptidase (beta-lactamase class C family)
MAPRALRRLAQVGVAAVVLAAVAACSDSAGTRSSNDSVAPAGSSTNHAAATADVEKRVQAFLDDDYTGGFDHIRAILVTVDGRPVFERYYHSSAAITSNVFSVTKSVMSVLIGIALDEGRLSSVDQTLAELLPTHAAAMAPQVRSITLRQVLTMTGGLPEESGFEKSRDWVQSILREGVDQAPGQGFSYSNSGSHLLSAILTEATGRSTLAYAREKLFTPLGIDTIPAAEPVARDENLPAYRRAGFAWPTDPQRHHVGFSFLKLTARDMEKLGRLLLNKGRWGNRQLVSADWVNESTRAQVETASTPEQYGYQWWVTTADGHPAFAAMGSGGQLVEVVPDLDLVVVVSSTAAAGNADSGLYLELVSEIAPAIGQ